MIRLLKISVLISFMMLTACRADINETKLCTHTIEDYVTLRDDPETAEGYAALFTVDGSFTLGGTETVGHEALIARHKSSHDSAKWQHEMNDWKIFQSALTGKITGTSQVTVMTGPKDKDEYTRKITATYEDKFVMQDGKCRIQSRIVTIVSDEIFGN